MKIELSMSGEKKIVYFDMDGVLVDFASGIKRLDRYSQRKYKDNIDEAPGIFEKMLPMPGAIQSYKTLAHAFDCYILSTPPWRNPSGWTGKMLWVKRYLGDYGYKRLILSHNKQLNLGEFLIDDRTKNGADRFTGEHIHFGTPKFPNWPTVVKYLMERK